MTPGTRIIEGERFYSSEWLNEKHECPEWSIRHDDEGTWLIVDGAEYGPYKRDNHEPS